MDFFFQQMALNKYGEFDLAKAEKMWQEQYESVLRPAKDMYDLKLSPFDHLKLLDLQENIRQACYQVVVFPHQVIDFLSYPIKKCVNVIEAHEEIYRILNDAAENTPIADYIRFQIPMEPYARLGNRNILHIIDSIILPEQPEIHYMHVFIGGRGVACSVNRKTRVQTLPFTIYNVCDEDLYFAFFDHTNFMLPGVSVHIVGGYVPNFDFWHMPPCCIPMRSGQPFCAVYEDHTFRLEPLVNNNDEAKSKL